MRRPVRVLVAFLTLLVAAAAGLSYPWLVRGDAWLGATWQHRWALLALLVIPFVLFRATAGEDRRIPRLGMGTTAPFFTGPRGFRAYLRDVPGIVRTFGLLFLVLALGRPVSVLRDQHNDERGIDIVLVLDLSASMRAVLDADPQGLPGRPQLQRGKRLTRLDTAKAVIKDFIERRRTDRIGVVVFGKSAYVLSPPTLDYPLLEHLVSKMSLDVIDGTATAIGDAVGTAVARLRRSDAKSKVVILLTDGESNAGMVSPEYAAHLASTIGCRIYPVQIGSGDEVDVEDGTDLFGQPLYQRQRYPVNPALLAKWLMRRVVAHSLRPTARPSQTACTPYSIIWNGHGSRRPLRRTKSYSPFCSSLASHS